MAVRCLRSKLSQQIFNHVLQDARIMPKGLPRLASEGSNIAPLVPESITFGFVPSNNAKNIFYNEATYNLCSSFEGKSGPIFIHGRRNFSSCPEGTKNIPKLNSGNKGSSRPGTEKIPGVKGDSDSSRSRSEETDILLKKQRKKTSSESL